MTEFRFDITSRPDGFTVSATADREPVYVELREWAWEVSSHRTWNSREAVGLIRTRHLVDVIAARMCQSLYDRPRASVAAGRPANCRVKYGAVPRTARIIHHHVLSEVKRLLDGVPDEVVATQRAVFAATFTTSDAEGPELYGPQYAMLRRDIRQYRATAAALAGGWRLVNLAAENEVKSSPELVAARALAEAAGLEISVHASGRTPSATAVEDMRREVLDRLARDWRGLFSPDGRPYRSLDRTLMNLPGGVPAIALGNLAHVRLERPVTDRVELVALLFAANHASRHESARRHLRLFVHGSHPDIVRAIALASDPGQPLSPRRAADIARAVQLICDYPEDHHGSIAGLARKACAWHRQMDAARDAEVIKRLGNREAAVPPIALPDTPSVTFLADVAAIAGEGTMMGHCAATYAQDAVGGSCYLFHIEHDGEMATAEVDWRGRVVQVQGPRNQPNNAARWGARVLSRWGQALAECTPTAPPFGGVPDPWEPAGDGEAPF